MLKTLFILFLTFNSINPYQYFNTDYDEALEFCQNNSSNIKSIFEKNGCDPAFSLSIVFPEITRFSIIKNIVETKLLELFYINEGTRGADYSIGKFQIKPSFAEKIETFLKADNKLAKRFAFLINYESEKVTENRRQRISRLKTTEWQLHYISAFVKIMDKRFPKIAILKEKDKIRFYASAYNYEFMSDSLTISINENKKNFPYGRNNENPFSYSEVSEYFFLNHAATVFK